MRAAERGNLVTNSNSVANLPLSSFLWKSLYAIQRAAVTYFFGRNKKTQRAGISPQRRFATDGEKPPAEALADRGRLNTSLCLRNRFDIALTQADLVSAGFGTPAERG